jgi:hypothetical protein
MSVRLENVDLDFTFLERMFDFILSTGFFNGNSFLFNALLNIGYSIEILVRLGGGNFCVRQQV